MKFFKTSILATVAFMGVAFTACSDDDDYTPAAPVDGVYFTSNCPSTVYVDPEETNFTVEVARSGETPAATYKLVVDLPAETAAKFTFPASVTFAAGQSKATFTVACDIDAFDLYEVFPAKVSFEEGTAVNPWGYTVYDFNIEIKAIDDSKYWKTIGSAVMIDAWICPFYNFTFSDGTAATLEDLAWTVETQESTVVPGRIRLVSPWTNEECVIWYNDINMNKSSNPYINIDASNPECVKILPQYSGASIVIEEGGEPVDIYIANLTGLQSEAGKTDEEIISAGENDVMESDAILVNVPQFALGSISAEYQGHEQQGAIVIVRDEEPTPVSPLASSMRNGKLNVKRYARLLN